MEIKAMKGCLFENRLVLTVPVRLWVYVEVLPC